MSHLFRDDTDDLVAESRNHRVHPVIQSSSERVFYVMTERCSMNTSNYIVKEKPSFRSHTCYRVGSVQVERKGPKIRVFVRLSIRSSESAGVALNTSLSV